MRKGGEKLLSTETEEQGRPGNEATNLGVGGKCTLSQLLNHHCEHRILPLGLSDICLFQGCELNHQRYWLSGQCVCILIGIARSVDQIELVCSELK